MSVNERQVELRLGSNVTYLNEQLDKVTVKRIPFNEAQSLTLAGVTSSLVTAATTVSGNIYTDGTDSGSGQGDIVAAVSAGFTAGTTTASATDTSTDGVGSLINRIEIRDALTHDPITSSDGRVVFGLLQAATGTSDHAAVVTTATSENLQISFVYYNSSSTLTLESVTATIEFNINKEYKKRYEPLVLMDGSLQDIDIIEDITSLSVSTFAVTTGTTAGASVLTLATGALTNGGASTRSGDTITMATISIFNKNSFVILDNGVEMLKGTDVTFSSAGNIQITRQLDIGDSFTVKDRA